MNIVYKVYDMLVIRKYRSLKSNINIGDYRWKVLKKIMLQKAK